MGSTIVRILSEFLMIVITYLALTSATRPDGFRGSLLRKAMNLNDDPLQAGEHSRRRLSEPTGVDLKGTALYVMELAIGTPPVTIHGLVGMSDLCWVECKPCSGCSTPVGARLYDRASSSSFSPLSCASQACKILPEQFRTTCSDTECGYRYVYGATDTDHNYVQGTLGTETFNFRSNNEVAMQSFTFGCTDTIYRNDLFDGNTGIVGLGRSKLSLVGQLGLDRFSYCLSSNPRVASPLLFGSAATVKGSGVSSTPLLSYSVNCYVNLLGISVDGTRLPIPKDAFVFNPKTGQDGVRFQMGAPATLLVDAAYTVVVDAFKARMSTTYKVVNGSRQLCFLVDASNVTVPTMTMHFEGMDMKLQQTNYFAFRKRQSDEDVLCLMIGRSRSSSLIGSIMQTDFHVLYDLKKSILSVQPADCSKV